MGAIEDAWAKLSQVLSDLYEETSYDDAEAAVRAALHAAYDLGWYAGDGEYEEQKARIDALGVKEEL